MKRKIKSAKGFTLAELLIVVAIIAVLVAIGIPIFTSQLEKSREAVDLSDVRSAYAEVMMAAITGDTTAYYTKDTNQTIYKTNTENSKGYEIEAGAYSITVTPLKQKQPNWQTAEPITIGGVSSKAGEPYWKGQPGPDGFCVITYHPPVSGRDEYVSFYWEGGSASDGPTVTPDPGNPTVAPIPGNVPNEEIAEIIKKNGYTEWPYSENAHFVATDIGQIIYYDGSYYISTTKKEYDMNKWWYTTPEDKKELIKITDKTKIYTQKSVNSQGNVPGAVYGGIFIDDDDERTAYIYKGQDCDQKRPDPNHDYNDKDYQWVRIRKN